MIPFINLPENNSKLTIELRELIAGGIDIWDFEYPSYYTGEAKKAFEQKVIDHYFFRQIGQETPARWLHYFRARIREIMPYYIQRYKSVAIMEDIEDPFESYKLTEEYTEERVGKGEVNGEASSDSTSKTSSAVEASKSDNTTGTLTEDKTRKFSNTPQGSIDNLDKYLTEGTIEDNTNTHNLTSSEKSETDATASSVGTSDQTSKQTTEDTETVKHTLVRRGNIGVATLAAEMNSFRTSFLNVDMEIIEELRDLFLLTY